MTWNAALETGGLLVGDEVDVTLNMEATRPDTRQEKEGMSTGMRDTAQLDGVPAPARLPEETHVGAVHLQIGDLPRSVEYYQTVLGLKVLEHDAGRASLGVGGGSRLRTLSRRKVLRRCRGMADSACITSPSCYPTGRRSADLLRTCSIWGCVPARPTTL